MASETDPIEIPISVEGAEQAVADLKKVSGAAGQMGADTHKAGAVGKLGLWGLGEAAEKAAQSMGIPNQAARRLGNTVEDLVGKTGKYAAMFGVVGLAVAGAVTAWKYYEDQQRKAREETIKAGQASGQWVEAALGETAKTNELAQAKKQLQQAEFDLNKARVEQALPAAKAALEELNKQYASAVKFQDTRSEISATVVKQYIEDIKLKVGEASAQLKLLEAQAGLFTDKNRSGLTGGKPKEEKSEVTVTNQYEREAAYQAQLVELYRATGVSKEEIWKQELVAFNAATAAKMANATSGQQYYDTLALREMERAAKVATYEKQLAEQTRRAKMESVKSSVDNFGQAAALMASMGGKHAREWFSVQKTASIAQAVINTATGATKALEQGGIYGAVLMASVIALGAAQIAKIRSQTFEGGDGGLATPTYSANSWTGLPQQQQGGGGTINIFVNGEKAGSYKTGAGAVLREIYEGNGSVDGYSVSVERHA